MTAQQKISKRIHHLCQEAGISFYELSYRSAVPITTMMHIIGCSTKNPGVLTIMKMCSGLGISISEFFDCDDFKDIEYDPE